MPITFYPNEIQAQPFATGVGQRRSGQELLKVACPNQYKKFDELLQTSFTGQEEIIAQTNGFVETLVSAYNQHLCLIIRPDDVWAAILVQFNFFVNANSDKLRSHFVAHEEKKTLVVVAAGSRYTVDFGEMSVEMTQKIHENVVDPSLRDWILPTFSTTTANDTVIFAVLMMATMKKYFKYVFQLRCGLPQVTLEGEKSDWEAILGRLEKLKEYGLETTAWYHLLKPVISKFVSAFDDPNGRDNLEFWTRVCHRDGGGSGPTYLGGWVTAFCVFDEDGKWIGPQLNHNALPNGDPASLSAEDFFKIYTKETRFRNQRQAALVLDGSPYHLVDSQKIPSGFTEVDVLVDDNGQLFPSMMTVGLIGMQVCSSGDQKRSATGERDTVKPIAGWWLFVKVSDENEREEAKKTMKEVGEAERRSGRNRRI